MLKLERLDESIVSNRLAVKTFAFASLESWCRSSVSNAENDELNKLLYEFHLYKASNG